jgi:hypothetical protein
MIFRDLVFLRKKQNRALKKGLEVKFLTEDGSNKKQGADLSSLFETNGISPFKFTYFGLELRLKFHFYELKMYIYIF